MCGIFGVVVDPKGGYSPSLVKKIITELAHLAQSRGKDSSGLVIRDTRQLKLHVLKGNKRIDHLLKSKEVRKSFTDVLYQTFADGHPFTTIGHSRLVTNGSQLKHDNNQPVVKGRIVGVHNGIITNDDTLWEKYSNISRDYEIDTEVFMAMIDAGLTASGTLPLSIFNASQEIEGTFSIALLCQAIPTMALATNNGSLYVLTNHRDFFAFASEEYPLKKITKILSADINRKFHLQQLSPDNCMLVSLDDFSVNVEDFYSEPSASKVASVQNNSTAVAQNEYLYSIEQTVIAEQESKQQLILDTKELALLPEAKNEKKLLEYNNERIRELRRCSRCVLPETFPFIKFDEEGVCNYCNNYKIKNNPKPFSQLESLIKPYRRSGGLVDCIVPFSGGRDSTFALHVIKERLGLNPIAFTYDWGMVTDLGRRNIARVCGKLGVENIIVAADIRRKRDNIRKNIKAWLNNPNIGMIPLFMAGDKYFYYYTNKVKKQTGIQLNIWGINPLENTDFKVGFMGVHPDFEKKHIYSLSVSRQIKLFGNVIKEISKNPSYLNSSVPDTIGSFISRSIMTHTHYYHLFDYLKWDETEVNDLVVNEYKWEKAIDTDTTWRIGDGTAAFYNYIYYTVAGFSEHDTFRSNQIREGQITREKALELVEHENYPRYPTFKWYCEIIGIDYESTVRRINSIPKLY